MKGAEARTFYTDRHRALSGKLMENDTLPTEHLAMSETKIQGSYAAGRISRLHKLWIVP